MSSNLVPKVKRGVESSFGQKTFVCLVKFFTFHIHRVTTTKKKRVSEVILTHRHTHRSNNNEISRNCFVLVFFSLFTDKRIKRSNISRDETAEVEHGVRFSGDTRLFSTHTVTLRKDMQEENTKHRYDTDYILFPTADSGFSARTLARSRRLSGRESNSFMLHCKSAAACFNVSNMLKIRITTPLHKPDTHTHTSKHTCKHRLLSRVPSEKVRKPLTSGSQRAGIQYWI